VDVDFGNESPDFHEDDLDGETLEIIEAMQGSYEDNYEDLLDLLNAYFEHEYYELTRRDMEWEVGAELQLRLWPGGEAAIVYEHHERISNIDDAPTPRWTETAEVMDPETGEMVTVEEVHELPAPRYSYTRDLLMFELRQYF
jgi:hypothetical protein